MKRPSFDLFQGLLVAVLIGLSLLLLLSGCAPARPRLDSCTPGERVVVAMAQTAHVALTVATLLDGRAMGPAPPQWTTCK